MKNEIYKQMPISPATGISETGQDIFTLSPSTTPGSINRIKAIYIDLPEAVILNINLSALGTGQDDINSPGNEAGSIVFRTGVEYNTDATITVTGATGTPYAVKIVTEVEMPETKKVEIINFPTPVTAIEVTNFPTPVTAIEVTNFPSVQSVEVTNFPTGPAQAGLSGASAVLMVGLIVGAIYATTRGKREEKTIVR